MGRERAPCQPSRPFPSTQWLVRLWDGSSIPPGIVALSLVCPLESTGGAGPLGAKAGPCALPPAHGEQTQQVLERKPGPTELGVTLAPPWPPAFGKGSEFLPYSHLPPMGAGPSPCPLKLPEQCGPSENSMPVAAQNSSFSLKVYQPPGHCDQLEEAVGAPLPSQVHICSMFARATGSRGPGEGQLILGPSNPRCKPQCQRPNVLLTANPAWHSLSF